MTTPALIRLRQAQPRAHISILTDAKLADLWHHHPALDSVLAFQRSEGLLSIARQLRSTRYDVGLIFPNSPRSALEFWLGRIPRRIGYAGSWRRGFLTDIVPPRAAAVPMRKRSVREIRQVVQCDCPPPAPNIEPAAHQIHDYLHLAARLGADVEPVAPVISVSDDEIRACRSRWNLSEESARPLFGLNPGAEYGPAKRWPADCFIAAAVEIQKWTQCRWLIFGAKSDAPLAEQIAIGIAGAGRASAAGRTRPDGLAVLNLAGHTTLRELCAALKICRIVLTNDTGPMHLAAAVGTPVVVPYGSTAPELTGPGLPADPRHRLLRSPVPCAPCFLRQCPIDFRCMANIDVDQVVQAVLDAARARP